LAPHLVLVSRAGGVGGGRDAEQVQDLELQRAQDGVEEVIGEPGELAVLQARYRELLEQVRGLGLAVPGSVIERYTVCAAPGCHCHDDPPVKHGPYLQYTRKLAGKTISRRLDPEQVERYREWIGYRAPIRSLPRLERMVNVVSQTRSALLSWNSIESLALVAPW
jgi:hypothetical protein